MLIAENVLKNIKGTIRSTSVMKTSDEQQLQQK
jgi:hypothetical protein